MFQPKPLLRTLDAALRDLQHPKPSVRRSALEDLSRLATGEQRDRVLGAMTKALGEDADPALRAAAAVALADAGAEECVPSLLDAAGDAQERVRQMAVLALGELSPEGNKQVAALLERTLRSNSPALRFQALLAASRIGIGNWSAHLDRGADDADPKLRYLALRLIDEGWSRTDDLPSELSARVEGALNDADAQVRTAAALVAVQRRSELGRRRVAEALNAGLSLPAPEDEQVLIELAGEFGVNDAAPGLRRAAWGRFGMIPGRFAWQARVALARLGDEAARRTIRKGLASRNRDARTLAVAAVGEARWRELLPELERLAASEGADPDALADALRQLRGS